MEAWGKLSRARYHESEVRSYFDGFLDGDILDIPIRKMADYNRGCISVTIKSLPIFNPALPLILGDAIHNYRCCLDYIWWQFAISHLGRHPSKSEERRIQFPILDDLNKWGSTDHFKYVSLGDVEFIKKFQPFSCVGGSYSAFEGLNAASNHDKHRSFYPVIAKAGVANYRNLSDRPMSADVFDLPEPIVVGSEIARFNVDLNGMDPESALAGSFRAYLSVQNDWNILEILSATSSQCQLLLEEADQIFLRKG